MKTYLLTWNPGKWDWVDLPRLANETSLGEVVQDRWSCSTKQIKPGDRCFLVMVGSEDRGIIASGWATSSPTMGEHWNPEKAAAGEECQFVNCEWEKLLNPKIDSPLPVSELRKHLEFHWTPQNSGVQIPDNVAAKLEELWAKHTGKALLAQLPLTRKFLPLKANCVFQWFVISGENKNCGSQKSSPLYRQAADD